MKDVPSTSSLIGIHGYEIETILRRTQRAPGYDHSPAWLFKKCSVGLADVVARLLSLSFASEQVYTNWKMALHLCLKLPVQLHSVISDPPVLHLLFRALLRKSLLRDG